MNSSNPLQTEESGIGNDIYYAASAVSPNSNYQVQRVPLFIVECTAEPATNAAQRLADQELEDPDSQELFLQCLTPVWHRDICVFAGQIRLVNLKGHICLFGGSKNSNRTDRRPKNRHFEINRFHFFPTMITMIRSNLSSV
jgi:hypothetical protein